jgi:hypothetical protein
MRRQALIAPLTVNALAGRPTTTAMRRLVDEALDAVRDLLTDHRDKLDALAEALLSTRRSTPRMPTPPPESRDAKPNASPSAGRVR